MPFMHETSAHGAGTAIEILVGTPHREIDVPIVQLRRDVARAMGKIKSDTAPLVLGCGGDPRDVKDLTGIEVRAAEHHERNLVALLIKRRFDVLDAKCVLTFSRRKLQEAVFRIDPTGSHMGGDCVKVGRKRRPLHHDLVSCLGRLIERHQHQVDVNTQAVHKHDFACAGFCPDQPSAAFAEYLVIRKPRRPAAEMRVDRKRPPVVDLLQDVIAGLFRLEAQRVACEVNYALTIRAARTQELLTIDRQRVAIIELLGKRFSWLV